MSVSDAQYQDWADDLADLDQQIEDLQKAKKDFYATVRDEHGKKTADALKSAIKITRMDSEKRSAAEEVEAEAFRIVQIIQAPRAPRATRARENIEEFPSQPSPKAGQSEPLETIHSDPQGSGAAIRKEAEPEAPANEQPSIEAHDVVGSNVSNAVAHVPPTYEDGCANTGGQNEVPAHSGSLIFPGRQQSDPAPHVAQNGSEHQRAEIVETNEAPAGRAADESPATTIISRAEGIKKLRPLCQSPEACRSSGGRAHCNTCLKAAGQSLVSA